MRLAGITHLFGLADQTPINNINNTGSNLKILDRRVSENRPGTDQPHLAGLYMFGLGVSPEDHPYRVGGQQKAALDETNFLWGFGKNNKRSTWTLDTVYGQPIKGTNAAINGQSYRTCPADTFGVMAAIKNDPDHFLLHTTGGPHLTINWPIKYYIGITGNFEDDTSLVNDEVVLELHVYTEIYEGDVMDAGRFYESSANAPGDTCTATVIYIRKHHLTGTGFKSYVSLDSFLGHIVTSDEKARTFFIIVNKVGRCIVNIKELFIVDQFYKEAVFPRLSRGTVHGQIATSIASDLIPEELDSLPAYEGIYLEEPKTLMNRSIRVVDSIAFAERGRNVAAMDWHRYRYQWEMMRYDWPRKSLDVDGYFITDAVSPVSNNNSYSIQEAINSRIKIVHPDRNTYHGLRANIEAANGFNGLYEPIPYINYIQIGEERHYVNDTDRYTNRTVSSQEIQMQGWLSLCFGAKGIGYYPGAEREDTYYDDNGWLQGVKWQGMFKSNSSGTEMIADTYRYNAVKKLNAEIDSIAQVYMKLKWKNSYNTIESGSAQPEYTSLINETIVASCTTRDVYNNVADPGNLRFVQVAFFDHETETGPNTYFIVMNRRVQSMESRYITLTFDNLNTTFSTNYSNWKITDVKKDTSYTIPANGGTYTFLCPPGEGKLFKLEPVVKSGYGRIRFDETVSQTVTVPSGKTMKIDNGVTLNFTNGSSLAVNGGFLDLSANTDTVRFKFNGAATRPSSNGIRINPGAQCSLKFAVITGAYIGLKGAYSSNTSIYGCRIDSNTIGLQTSNVGDAQTVFEIDYSSINYNYIGLSFDNGTGNFTNTWFRKNTIGVSAINGSLAYGYDADLSGKNRISNSLNSALYASGYSYLDIGNEYAYDAMNTVVGNDNNDATPMFYSTIEARHVWWGTYPANPVYDLGIGSAFYYDPERMTAKPLQLNIEDPSGISTSGSVSMLQAKDATDDISLKTGIEPITSLIPKEGSDPIRQLNLARKYFAAGYYEQGAKLCKDIIKENPLHVVAIQALSFLREYSKKNNPNGFSHYLSGFSSSGSFNPINSAASLIDARMDARTYEKKIDALIKKYVKRDEAVIFLYDKFAYKLFVEDKIDDATIAYLELQNQFPENTLTKIAYALLNPTQFSVSQNLMSTENNQVPKEYGISNNYPNPFNPETSIDYAIPYPSNVVIELYGVTGEKVRTLVQSEHTPGFYTYHLTNTSGMASGIYFYRIAATNLQTGKVFTTVRKMTLMK